MTWFTAFVLYMIIWWTVIFAVLPWGAKPPAQPGLGHAQSAPERPNLLRKALITTAISTVIWAIAFAIIQSDLFPIWPKQ